MSRSRPSAKRRKIVTALALTAFWGNLPILGELSPTSLTADRLVRMSPSELDLLYRNAAPGPLPRGRVRGRVLIDPGANYAPAVSNAARVWWQGKVFSDDGTSAVNRFLGVRIVKGKLYLAPSWIDGRPSVILDYHDTSLVYRRYRDEIRQVAPGLYLGAMYARTEPKPTFKMYFALETNR